MGESCPKLLDLISKDQKQNMKGRNYGSSSNDERKLELRLGLPGDENWCTKNNQKNCSIVRERNESLLSLGYFSSSKNNNGGGVIRCGQEQNHHLWSSSSFSQQKQQTQNTSGTTTSGSSPFLQNHNKNYKTCPQNQVKGLPVMGKDSSQTCCTRIVELQTAEKKAFSPSTANTAVNNTSQKRAAPTPVVGWPPIRSFRRNLATSSSGKAVSEPQSVIPSKPVNEKLSNDDAHKGLFVKINMDGVPIGRKVDLSAHDNYDSLSSAVDKLFRGLLAAQRDSSAGAIDSEQDEQKPITGLLDGSGEYTLVYEDNEGDRMLVGDVPWHMFVSTVKRLRVLKSSDLPMLSRGGSKEGKAMVEIPSK